MYVYSHLRTMHRFMVSPIVSEACVQLVTYLQRRSSVWWPSGPGQSQKGRNLV